MPHVLPRMFGIPERLLFAVASFDHGNYTPRGYAGSRWYVGARVNVASTALCIFGGAIALVRLALQGHNASQS